MAAPVRRRCKAVTDPIAVEFVAPMIRHLFTLRDIRHGEIETKNFDWEEDTRLVFSS